MSEPIDLETLAKLTDDDLATRYIATHATHVAADMRGAVDAVLADRVALRERVADLEGVANQAYLAICFQYGGVSEEDAGGPEDRAMVAAMGALHVALGLEYAEALKQREVADVERLLQRVAELEKDADERVASLATGHERLRQRIAELEAVSRAKDDHIAARTDDRDYYAHRVEELEAALRTVLDNALFHDRGGADTDDDYVAARAVLNVVKEPGHVPPCSHAARVAELEAALKRVEREPTPTDLVHELHQALYGRPAVARPVPPQQVWAELLAEVERRRMLEAKLLDQRAELEGEVLARDSRAIGAAQRILRLEGDLVELRHARERIERATVLEGVLSGVADAVRPWLPDAPPWSSHGEQIATEDRLQVAVNAARALLGETPDGPRVVLVDPDYLALLVGTIHDWVPEGLRDASTELGAVMALAEAVLGTVPGRAVQVVATGGAL